MLKTIPVDNLEWLDKLERAQLEVTARENILYLLISGNEQHSDAYEEIWKEYLQYLKQYGIVKNQFYIECVKKYVYENNANGWVVDFDRKELNLDV